MDLRTSQQQKPVSTAGGVDHSLCLDKEAMLGFVGDRRIEFSPREWQLMEYFVQHPERAISFQELLENVFHSPKSPNNTVIVLVRRINHKLAAAGCTQRIESVRCFGYRWMYHSPIRKRST